MRIAKLFLVITCLFALFIVVGFVGIAAAAAIIDPVSTATLHDPTVAPLQAINDVTNAWSVMWPLGALVAAYASLKLASSAGAKNGIAWLAWLGQGRVSVVIAGATGIVAAVINSLATGAPWMAAVFAGVLAGSSYWHPAGTASSSSAPSAPPAETTVVVSSTSAPTKGFVRVNMLLAIAAAAALAVGGLIGCGGGLSGAASAAEADVVDCVKADSGGLLASIGEAISALLVYVTDSSGNVDTAALKSAGLGDAATIGGCLLADAFGKQASSAAAGSAAPKSSALVISPAQARAAMAKLYPGKHFHTSHGDL